jgi:signal transduction histidine kinase
LSSILGLLLVLVVIVTLTINSELDQTIEHQARDLIEERANSASLRITNELSQAARTLDMVIQFAQSEIQIDNSLQEWEREAFRVLLVSPYASGIRLTLYDGTDVIAQRLSDSKTFVTQIRKPDQISSPMIYRDAAFMPLSRVVSEEDGIDSRQKAWYQSALRSAANSWTQSGETDDDDLRALTVSKAFSRSDGQSGVAAVHVDSSSLRKAILESLRDSTEALMILDRKGNVVLYGDGSAFIDHSSFAEIAEYGDTIPAQAFSRDLQTTDKITSIVSSLGTISAGERHLTVLQPLGYSNLPWLIGMHVSEASLTADMWASRDLIPIIILLAFVATFLLAIPVARGIIRPIENFSSQSQTSIESPVNVSGAINLPYRELSATSETLSREITQRRSFQIAYQRTFDFSSRGMARMDPTTYRFSHANSPLCQLTGLTLQQLLARDLWNIVDPSHHQALEPLGASIMSDKEFTLEIKLHSADKPETWLRLTTLLIRNHLGHADHALLLLDDITLARSAEDRLDRLKRDLYHIGRVNMMGELAEGLAHELNQPLSAIIHDLDAVKQILGTGVRDREDLEAIFTDIENHALRAGDIIKGLRNLIRKDRSQKEIFDLRELVEQTYKLMSAEARQGDVILALEPGLPCMVRANRSQLAQVLVNLVRNAVEALALRDGASRCVRLGYVRAGGKVRLIVEDNGPGLPIGSKPFSKFETTRVSGLGLGLSICKSLVEENDGTISHEGVVPSGARFVIVLSEHLNPTQGGTNA